MSTCVRHARETNAAFPLRLDWDVWKIERRERIARIPINACESSDCQWPDDADRLCLDHLFMRRWMRDHGLLATVDKSENTSKDI